MARASSPRRGDRRLAPRRLGSGRRVRADAEARRHGRRRRRRRASRRASMLLAAMRPAQLTQVSSAWFSGRRFDVAPDYAYRPTSSRASSTRLRLRSRSRTTSVPKRAGATVCQVTARDFEFTYAALRSVGRRWGSGCRTRDSERHGRRREDGQSRSSLPSRRLARAFPARPALACARGRGPRDVWLDGIDNPKTGKAIGSGPFLVEHWEHGAPSRCVRNPRYWGTHPAYLDRLVLRFWSAAHGARSSGCARARSTSPQPVFTDEQVPALRSFRGVRVLPNQGANWEHFDVRMDPAGIPRSRSKLVRQALAYGIDRVALRGRSTGVSSPQPAERQRDVLDQERATIGRTGAISVQADGGAPAARAGGLSQGPDGIYVVRRASGSRSASSTLAGSPRRQQALELVQAPASAGRDRGRARVRSATVVFDEILPSGNFDVALFSCLLPRSPASSAGASSGAGACRTSRATASGLSRATSTRPSESSTPASRRAS